MTAKNKVYLQIGIAAAATLMVLVLCYFFAETHIGVACVMALLSVVMACCLSQKPLWLHGLVIVALIVLGVIEGSWLLMVFMAVVYSLAVNTVFQISRIPMPILENASEPVTEDK